jgi:hypothetical protein
MVSMSAVHEHVEKRTEKDDAEWEQRQYVLRVRCQQVDRQESQSDQSRYAKRRLKPDCSV